MKPILLKLSGELFKTTASGHDVCMDTALVGQIIKQIQILSSTHHISIVVGGGNFFRGAKEGHALSLRPTTADSVGMLATVMNSLILRDFFYNHKIACTILSPFPIPGIIQPIDQAIIDHARINNQVIIFAGGTGNPFFTTDTTAVLRALQVGAQEVWKATKVEYVYDADPVKNPDAKQLKKISYTDVLQKKLQVMDLTAITLAQEHNIVIRVFSLFSPDALLHVAQDPEFGSTICT